MKITIQGRDYSGSLDAVHPLTIERKLNEPTVCQFWLSLPAQGPLATPVRNQAVAVTGDHGTVYFTGYIACAPLPEFAGLGLEGPRYRIAVRAVSDEVLMDQLPATAMTAASGMTAGQLMASLVTHTTSGTLATQGGSLQIPVSSFAAAPGSTWSKNAGLIAGQARATYRAQSGTLQLSEIPAAVHPLNEADGSLNLAALSFAANGRRQFANDITICGEHEPVAYVTEYFLGDGATSQFNLGDHPYFPPAATSALIDELFNQPDLDLTAWANSGAPGSLALGAGGLAINGGSGADGQTMLTWLDSIELGGTLLMEASGVTLANGSSGILAGLYVGSDTVSGCIAGFQVNAQPGTGEVSVRPIVLGQPSGTQYAISPAKQYTLRIRLHCPECERFLAIYRSFGDDGAITNGGQANQAPAQLFFDIQECVNGVAGMSVTLFDGSISSLPPTCSVVAASLINMAATMRAFRLTNLGTGWVVSTPAGGNSYTRRLGSPAEGGECNLDRSGRLVFAIGFIPPPGERIAVSYRTQGRAVGRAVNSASQQALAALGLPAVSQWIGAVSSPPARSSADCRNAAAAIVAASAGISAQWSGAYKCGGAALASDVWPGDALLFNAPSLHLDSQVVVRSVKLTYASTYPDLVDYDIRFANDWADDLAIKTSDSVPEDVWLPAPISSAVLPNLTKLTVSSLSGTTVTVNTGVAPPAGGGFEIRRRDFVFMPGEDSDLVMRGSQQNLTFSRETAGDRFYIRMYDGSTPPNYSEFSTTLFFNLPVDNDR
jgi:hypothetical protein